MYVIKYLYTNRKKLHVGKSFFAWPPLICSTYPTGAPSNTMACSECWEGCAQPWSWRFNLERVAYLSWPHWHTSSRRSFCRKTLQNLPLPSPLNTLPQGHRLRFLLHTSPTRPILSVSSFSDCLGWVKPVRLTWGSVASTWTITKADNFYSIWLMSLYL